MQWLYLFCYPLFLWNNTRVCWFLLRTTVYIIRMELSLVLSLLVTVRYCMQSVVIFALLANTYLFYNYSFNLISYHKKNDPTYIYFCSYCLCLLQTHHNLYLNMEMSLKLSCDNRITALYISVWHYLITLI